MSKTEELVRISFPQMNNYSTRCRTYLIFSFYK